MASAPITLHPQEKKARRRVLSSSLAGTTIEWYEFFIYGSAAALVFNTVFFPTADPLIGTLLSLSTFAVAFVARPVGAALFGHFGDRIGRKASLVITLTMMGVATFLIGVLPSYDTAGHLGAVLLVVLRFIQGLSLGGEYSGAILMSVEHAGEGRRGLFGALVNIGSALGLILANITFIIVSQLTGPSFLVWGWRIPFLLSAILVIIGLVIRLKVEESPEFVEMRRETNVVRSPLAETLKNHLRPVLLTALAYLAAGVVFYMAAVFSLAFGREYLELESSVMLTLVVLAYVLNGVAMPFFGWLSDRVWGRKRIFVGSVALLIVAPFAWFALLETKNFALMLLGFVVLFLPFSANYGVLPTYFAYCFPPGVRYTGMAIGYTLGTLISAGIAPIVAVTLLAATGGWTAIALYMSSMAALSLVAAVFLHEWVKTRPATQPGEASSIRV